MTRHGRITTGEPFSLQRRNPAGGTAPLTGWGFRNETDPLTDVLLGSPNFLRHLSIIGRFGLDLNVDRRPHRWRHPPTG